MAKAANTKNAISETDTLVSNALHALETMRQMDQEQVDRIVKSMAMAGMEHHMMLAKMAVEETGRGVYEDKITKNMFATEYIYHSVKDIKTVGVIESNDAEGYDELAEPVGVIAGVTPVTNPTSTTLFKSLIALKARNPIIFGFHPSAQKCSAAAARIMQDAAVKAGAPPHCIQWISQPSIDATNALMHHPGVSLILATGGSGMVRAAYSCGKPALGVGPGNVPCYIEQSANVERACHDLILSKTFDNGMICASEQAVIVDREIADAFESCMKENGCRFLTPDETQLLSHYAFNAQTGALNPAIVGQSAAKIAEHAGITVPPTTKILLARLDGVGADVPLSREKLSPILAYYVVQNAEEGIQTAEKTVEFGGLGHSAVIHTENTQVLDAFRRRVKAGRLIINSPSSQGAIGDIYTTNMPSLTLGCGSFGGNSVSGNVTVVNLINKKRVTKRRVNMQWFKVPEKIYFETGSAQYLEKMPDISRAFLVTDALMVQLGYVDKILYYLRKRKHYVHCEIFADVEPDPDVETVMRGVKAMEAFRPDVIIALGGGSVIDAAKGMWLFHEHPDADFSALKLKFMDIRKRLYKFPKLGSRCKLVAIPTTSGTGSEVTSFSVITDRAKNVKYPLADYELTPDVAIIDPNFVMTVPPSVTADTGLDVLTHAIESYLSVLASDFTDALAQKAVKLVFDYLPRAYRDGSDREAREKMHNASCMAGMAFTNAFLGINHSLAHKLGGEFHIPHGRANAILLPHVLQYNTQLPAKFTIWPKYETFIADRKTAELAAVIGCAGKNTADSIERFIAAIRNLMRSLDMPASVRECGIDKKTYMNRIGYLAERAFEDQCTTANPRMPLVSELEELYRNAY